MVAFCIGAIFLAISLAGAAHLGWSDSKKETGRRVFRILERVGVIVATGAGWIFMVETNWLLGVSLAGQASAMLENDLLTRGFGLIYGSIVVLIVPYYAGWLVSRVCNRHTGSGLRDVA